MKDLKDFIREQQEIDNRGVIEEGKDVKDEKSFREYAEKKFKEAFGDELDEDKMNKTIEGILKDNEDKDWGEKVGILNKSFGDK